jgi:5-methylcytosine-specific restriction endonuclease McrA
MSEIPTSKVCTKCLIDKSLADFSGNKNGKYGKHSVCKACSHKSLKSIRLRPEEIPLGDTKKCTKCKETKLVDQFMLNSAVSCGRNSTCKDCYNAANRAYLLVPVVQPDFRECSRCKETKPITDFNRMGSFTERRSKLCKVCHYLAQAPRPPIRDEVRLERNAKARKRKRENPGLFAIHREKYRETHPGADSQRSAQWRLNNPEKARATRVRRRARKAQAEGSFTGEEWASILQKFNNLCAGCGPESEGALLTVDHIIPLARGGTNWAHNIQPMCASCNSSKNDKTMDEWLLWKAVKAKLAA